MASRPIWRAFLARMDACDAMELITSELAAGKLLARVAKDRGWSLYMVYKYLHLTDERWERYQEAKRLSAAAIASEAMDIADDSAHVLQPHEVTAAKLRVDTRKWAAGVLNREEFGEKAPSVSVQIGSVGELHLGALQTHGGPEAQKALPARTEPLPAEVLEDAEEQDAHDPSPAEHAAATGGEAAGEQGAELPEGA